MPDQPNIPSSDAGSADAFQNIFNDGAADSTISSDGPPTTAPQDPAPAPQAVDSGDPPSQGDNQEPGPQNKEDGTPQAADANGPQQADENQPPQPKDDPDRWQYWQSEADRKAAELNKLKEQIQQQNPLMKHLSENPQLAQKVYQTVQQEMGQQPNPSQGAPQQQQQQPSLEMPERPTKPEKPSDYDPMDAVSDSTSSSYKYRKALEEYNEAMVSYNEQLIEVQDQRRAQQEQAQQAKAQRNQQMKQVYNEAVYRHGMRPHEAQKFIKWASQPNYSIEDLVSLYRNKTQTSAQAQQKATNLQQRNQRLNNPAPPATQGNAATQQQQSQQVDPNDPQQAGEAFTEALFGAVGQ